jgi:signal transduction histidine kinase
MRFEGILNSLNIFLQCKKYHLPLWQCPHFIFLLIGLLIIFSSITSYIIGSRYIFDPLLVATITLFLAAVLFFLGFILVKSFEKLAETSRLKSEFIAILSHQLRTPLSNLKWVLEMMMSGRIVLISKKQLEYFKLLKENSERMDQLIKDLFIVSQIEAETLPLKKEEFFLEDLVKSAIDEFKSFAEASNVEIIFEKEKDLPKIYGDKSKIKLVAEKLLDNAIRYTRGRGKVKISLKKIKNKIYFEIEDEGVGIPKAEQKFIFEKFFRSSNILRLQTQGTGLGLFISKKIVEKSGGKIGFKSQEGKGSKFYFTLPIK